MRTVLIESRSSNERTYEFKVNSKSNVFIPLEVLNLVGNKHEKKMQLFYNRLFMKHPNLTKNEKNICGFIKLGFDTNQISCLKNKSRNSIEVARTRLRNKISLTNKLISLEEYLDLI